MKLQALALENFRAFSGFQMEFHPELTVLVGKNESGKTSVLDAAALALSAYTGSFPGVPDSGLSLFDVRRAAAEGGMQPQGPARISAQVEICGHSLAWSRGFPAENGAMEARAIRLYAAALQEHMRRQADVVLPVLAYYGAPRQWLADRETGSCPKGSVRERADGYLDWLHAAGNEKRMLNWLENQTYGALQQRRQEEEEPRLSPGHSAVKQAMERCLRSLCPKAEAVEVRFDVVHRELEAALSAADGQPAYMPVRLLGGGLRAALMLVADLACRMAILNPQLGADALRQTPGVVLIDEIEAQLHPAWQKNILGLLRELFPQVQWIVTTRSPVVLANLDSVHIRTLSGGQVYRTSMPTYGRGLEKILEEVMRTSARPDAILEEIRAFYQALDEQKLELAKEKLGRLRGCLDADDPVLAQAAAALELME